VQLLKHKARFHRNCNPPMKEEINGTSHIVEKHKTASSWFKAEHEAQGTIIVVHGLNNAPDSMLSFIEVFRDAGFAVLRVELAGHYSSGVNRHEVLLEDWYSDISAAIVKARDRYPDKPVFVFGYSLGASLVVSFLDKFSEQTVEGMVLLAPAIRLRTFLYTVRSLTWLRKFRIGLPSLAPRKYRVWTLTPLQQYHLLLCIVDNLKVLQHPARLNAIPCQIMLSSKDELIGHQELKSWIKNNNLSKWKLTYLPAQSKNHTSLEHMCLDESSAGREQWAEISMNMTNFYQGLVK